MAMVSVKIDELSGLALDYAVAKCEGVEYTHGDYSADWSLAGPIIEREIVSLDAENGKKRWKAYAWRSDLDLQSAIGPTPLVAAMRCYVASKAKGDSVMIPEELI
jgi:hypothetical protein